MNTTDTLIEINKRLTYMSEGLTAIGLAANNAGSDAEEGMGSAVYMLGLALGDITDRMEQVTNQLQEAAQ